MKCIDIKLDLDYKKLGVKHPEKVSLTGFILENFENLRQEEKRPAILVIHGGGYGGRTETETTPLALPFLTSGISAFVLRYSLSQDGEVFPSQFIEMCESIKLIRENALKWNIDKNKIFVIGGSAGGHLAACAGTIYDSDIAKQYGYDKDTVRADGMILLYPVISSKEENGHLDSFKNLLGEKYEDKKLLDFLSLEDRVTKDTPPTFLMHTRIDDTVPVNHSMVFANKLLENDVDFEMHIYKTGWHGMVLANDVTSWCEGGPQAPHCQDWINKAIEWIKLL